jgi:hypothetical protein
MQCLCTCKGGAVMKEGQRKTNDEQKQFDDIV